MASISSDEGSVIMVSLGSINGYFLMSGIIWPLEGMSITLRHISYLLPQTLSIKCLRDIMLNGWAIDNKFVALGFLSNIIWILVYILLFTMLSKSNK